MGWFFCCIWWFEKLVLSQSVEKIEFRALRRKALFCLVRFLCCLARKVRA